MITLRYFLVFILCCYALCVNAQTSNNTFRVPDIIPKSPEAASLGRYGEVPVGEYSGAANISVPLHVVKGGKLEFPINLTYNSTGIRVNQEATWVGLGWDISAMAGITYVPVDGNDQTYTVSTPWSDVKTMIDYVNPQKLLQAPPGREDRPTWCDGYMSPYPGWTTKVPENALGWAKGAKGGIDMFNVNCLNLSFKFYINPETNQAKVFGDKSNSKIEIINGNINSGFKITDNNGVLYYFNAIEQAPNAISNWYITEIRRPDGDWIKFRYTSFGTIIPIPSLAQQYMASGSLQFAENSGYRANTFQQAPQVANLYLTELESATELVQFVTGGNRLDLLGNGARKLEAMQITDKFTGNKRTWSFQYDYFEGSYTGGNYLELAPPAYPMPAFTQDHLKKRLKLISVIEKGSSNQENQKYTLSYNEDAPLPYKTSFAMDHWGYYNGQNNTTFIPQLFSLFLYDAVAKNKVSNVDLYGGAYRGCSKNYITTGMLKSLTYPSGGRSDFTFAPNSFSGYMILSAEEEIQIKENVTTLTSYDFNTSPGSYSVSFTLTEQTVVDFAGNIHNRSNQGGLFNCNQMANNSIVLFAATGGYPTTTWRAVCGDFDQNGNLNKTWSQQLTLPAGNYALITTLPDALGFQGYNPLVVASIKYRSQQFIDQLLANHSESIGGGLRMKRVDNYSEDNNLVSSREYGYIKENGTTSGKLIAPLKYTEAATSYSKGVPGDSTCSISSDNVVLFGSNSISPVSLSSIRAPIGYDRVEIADKGSDDQASNGKTVKTFRNEAVSEFFGNIVFNSGVFSNDGMSNGDLLSTTYLSHSGSKVREEIFIYENTLIEKDWINLKIKDFYVGSFDCLCAFKIYGYDSEQDPVFTIENARYAIVAYPYINYKNVLKKKTQIDYTAAGNLTTQTDYEYNSNNYEINKIKTINSKGELYTTTIKYADDFRASSSLYNDMVNANMVSLPVETIKYKGETEQLEKVTTTYSLVDNFYIEPVSVEKQLKAFTPAALVIYNRYSEGGNIAEFKAANGIYNAFIWGYNSTFPIASVENARLANIFYTGFEETDGNSANKDCKTGLKSHTGTYSKQLTGLDNGSYIFSYWTKTGSAWELKTQTVNVTSGSYTISFTSAQQVDDIRFHPANSHMKTFTYEPTNGITSATDINNRVTYYEYDEFGRLSLIRDWNNNILKKICYNYAGQIASCPL